MISLVSCDQKAKIESNPRPNIVLIITDDQGYGDVGLHGNPVIQTPTLDSLGRVGVRLSNFYVSPVCAPTRSSLMTGRYSLRTGVFDTYNGGAIMSESEITLAEYLKRAGYATGIFGKWHLGDTYPFRPQDQGFDMSCVHAAGGMGQPGDFYENFAKGDSSYFNPILDINGIKKQTRGYCSDVFTDKAIEFINTNHHGPFFAYISYNAPHTPLQVPEEYLLLYDTADIRPDRFKGNKLDMKGMTMSDYEAARRVYAMVTNIDDNFRRIWKTIDDNGISENTIIVFMTDNGPQQRRYNGGMRNRKGSVYEGGIRVPSFWYWPGKFNTGERKDLTAHIDVLPTILDICKLSVDPENPVDGRSFLPVLTGDRSADNDRVLVHYWYRGYLEPYHNIAYRSGKFKLVGQGDYRMSNDDFELYDTEADPGEEHDISSFYPGLVDSLRSGFDEWYREIMNSKNLNIQRIKIGTSHQNPVVLNRNDARGASAKQWMSETGMGYWDVSIAKSGLYDVRVRFFNAVRLPGSITIRFGKMQRTIETTAITDNLALFEGVHLEEGPCMVEAWHLHEGTIFAPLYVEVYKREE